MNKLIIVGAGGHGKAVADLALKNGYTDIAFVDDRAAGECMGFPIIGTCDDLEKQNDGKTDFVIAIGRNETRKAIAEAHDVNWVTIIHPTAVIAVHVSIGKGTVVMAGAVVNTCAEIGEHCIINTAAVVEHDNTIGDFVHISPGVKLSGAVSVGCCTWIGIGACVINNLSICGDVVVGAGSVVVKDIKIAGTYYGIVSQE